MSTTELANLYHRTKLAYIIGNAGTRRIDELAAVFSSLADEVNDALPSPYGVTWHTRGKLLDPVESALNAKGAVWDVIGAVCSPEYVDADGFFSMVVAIGRLDLDGPFKGRVCFQLGYFKRDSSGEIQPKGALPTPFIIPKEEDVSKSFRDRVVVLMAELGGRVVLGGG